MISILFVGAFVAFLNNTLLNVALPTIMKDFGITYSSVQWLATGYMLVSGILVPASAFFVTRFKIDIYLLQRCQSLRLVRLWLALHLILVHF